jgi:hypothetical protein
VPLVGIVFITLPFGLRRAGLGVLRTGHLIYGLVFGLVAYPLARRVAPSGR